MGPIRVSVTAVVGLGTLLVLGPTALLQAGPDWARLVYTLVLLTLAIATLGGLFARGRARAFWAGFALAGWAFLLAPGSIKADLLTDRWLAQLGLALHPLTASPNPPAPADTGASTRTYYDARARTYHIDVGGKAARAERIGRDLLALVLAGAGGLVAFRFASAPHRPGL